MPDGAAIIGVLVFLVVMVVVGTLVGAIILRAAVSLYNKFAGGPKSPSAVPEPSMGKAMGIMFVTMVVNGVVGFMLGVVIGGAAQVAGARGGGGGALAQLGSVPVSILVMATMLTAMLPTNFGRAILVTFCHLLISIVIVAIVGVFIAIVSMFLIQ